MKTIQELIAEFLALHPTDWDTCTKAFCECTTATYMFVDFCRLNSSQEHVRGSEIFIRAGKGNPDSETYKPGVNDDGVECCDWHIIVEADSCFIDWTARQYDSARPYPYIIPKEQALAAKA